MSFFNNLFEIQDFFSLSGLIFVIFISLASLVLSVFVKLIITHLVFKYDTKRRDSIIKSMYIFIFICYFAILLAQFTGNTTVIFKALLILFAFKVLYHLSRNAIVELYGKEVEIDVKITSSREISRLTEKLSSIEQTKEQNKVEIEKDIYYKIKEDTFFRKKNIHVSTKATSLLEIGILFFFSLFAATIIIDILEPLHNIFKSSYTIPAVAFLGAYVFNPAFPDIYAFITFLKNKNIDLEKFISFKDQGQTIKGRIISMNTSHLIIKDHVLGITKTVPNRELVGKIIDNLSSIENKLGIKQILEYVIAYEIYQDKSSKLIKSTFNQIFIDFEEKTKAISKQEEYSIWIVPDNDGVKVILWYFIKNIEDEEKIKLDIEDFILVETTKVNYDLRTPKLIEIISNNEK